MDILERILKLDFLQKIFIALFSALLAFLFMIIKSRMDRRRRSKVVVRHGIGIFDEASQPIMTHLDVKGLTFELNPNPESDNIYFFDFFRIMNYGDEFIEPFDIHLLSSVKKANIDYFQIKVKDPLNKSKIVFNIESEYESISIYRESLGLYKIDKDYIEIIVASYPGLKFTIRGQGKNWYIKRDNEWKALKDKIKMWYRRLRQEIKYKKLRY